MKRNSWIDTSTTSTASHEPPQDEPQVAAAVRGAGGCATAAAQSGVAVRAPHIDRVKGHAAGSLSSAHWQHALICAQFALAAYGGGQSPAGEKQPQVRELDPITSATVGISLIPRFQKWHQTKISCSS